MNSIVSLNEVKGLRRLGPTAATGCTAAAPGSSLASRKDILRRRAERQPTLSEAEVKHLRWGCFDPVSIKAPGSSRSLVVGV